MVQSDIKEFFANQIIFITGGTGFVGKVLIEKLLRECYDLNRIYLLVRPKKGKTSTQRFEEIFNYPCFEKIKLKPIKDKVFLIDGDCALPSLGLNGNDQIVLKNEVSCVIHAAANVKFDQTFKNANETVKATRDLLVMAKEMSKLKTFVYVSTAFSNCIHLHVREEFYRPPMKPELFIDFVDAVDDGTLQAITPPLLGEWPNTYVYTKCLAEELIRTMGKDLPITIVRPGIIGSSAEEPIPGWIDNFYGLVGISAAAALGVLRCLLVKLDAKAHMVPVDYVANNILAAVWAAGQEKKLGAVTIYNYTGHNKRKINYAQFISIVLRWGFKIRTTKTLWYCGITISQSEFWYNIWIFFKHTIPAYIVDFILICIRKEPLAVKNYQRLHKMIKYINYFTTRVWDFDTDNVYKLWDKMGETDKKLFNFNMEHFDYDDYLKNGILGGRVYLLKDPLETLPQGRRWWRILAVLHYTVVALFWYFVFKLSMFIFYCFYNV